MAVGFLHVINNMKGIDMTITATLPPVEGTAETKVRVMTDSEIVDVGISQSDRLKQNIKRAWEQTKSFFRRAWNWTRDKVSRAYTFTRDKVVVPAAKWIGRNSRVAAEWVARNSRRAWFWSRSTALRLWRGIRPLGVLTTSIMASGFAFVAFHLSAAVWIFLAVLLGSLVWRQGRRHIIVQKIEPAKVVTIAGELSEDEYGPVVMDEVIEATMVLNEAQSQAVADRISYLEEQSEKHVDESNTNLHSNYRGRIYLARHRWAGDESKPEELHTRYKVQN